MNVPELDVSRVLDKVAEDVGPIELWPTPVLLPSLAQCVMNSIFSTGNRSESVIRVLDRYRCLRRQRGHDPALDGPSELLDEIRSCGGPTGFADALESHWRAWSRKSAPLKAEVIHMAAVLLQRRAINTTADLARVLGDDDELDALKRDWLALPGQGSGLTWRYFLMNAGMPGIKADRMITRWISRTLGRRTTKSEAEQILVAAADRLGVEDRRLDHALWSFERSRP